MWFPPQVPASSLFFTHQLLSTGTAVGVDQSLGRQHAHIIFWLAVRARHLCMKCQQQGMGKWRYHTGVSGCLCLQYYQV